MYQYIMYMQSDASPFFRIFSFFWGWTHSTWVQVLGIDLDEFVTGCMQLHGPCQASRREIPGANLSANLTD